MENGELGLETGKKRQDNETIQPSYNLGVGISELKEIYSGIIAGFGTNHAKIYFGFLGKEIKDAKQVIQETRMNKVVAYRALDNLVEFGLLKHTNTRPRLYFSEKPIIALDRHIRKYARVFEQKRNELKKIVMCSDVEKIEEYLIKMGPQTRLLNSKTKEPVNDIREIKSIQKWLEGMAEKKKDLAYNCAYGRA